MGKMYQTEESVYARCVRKAHGHFKEPKQAMWLVGKMKTEQNEFRKGNTTDFQALSVMPRIFSLLTDGTGSLESILCGKIT